MRLGFVIVVGAFAVGIVPWAQVAGVERLPRSSRDVKLEAVVHFDFFVVEGGRVGDASGQHHDGQLQNGEVVEGKRKPAVQFQGNGAVSLFDDKLDPSQRSLTVGALCKASASDGVIASLGDATNGFSLYIKDAVPRFVVRADGQLFEVASDEQICLDQWVHLVGIIGDDGKLSLIVNGWPVATGMGRVIPHKPAEGFYCGADLGSAVGDYEVALHWEGLLEDVRLYWGSMDRDRDSDQLKDWADMPGCGCRK